MATQEELIAAIATINRKLERGVTRLADGERQIQYDHDTLRKRKAELEAELGTLLSGGRTVRRVLTYSTKGY